MGLWEAWEPPWIEDAQRFISSHRCSSTDMADTSSTQHPRVILLGFLDTKYEEHNLVHDKLTELGCDVDVIDLSTRPSPVSSSIRTI